MKYDFSYVSEELRGLIEPATRSSHRFDSDLQVREFPDAYIAPYIEWEESIGCILDRNGTAIRDSGCLEWKENGGYYDLSQSLKRDKDAVFLGFVLTPFGHSFTDDLRKLWFVKTPLFESLVTGGAEVVYTTNWNHPLPDSVKEMIKMAGYDISKARHITELTQYRRVIVPDNCFRATSFGRIYSKEYKQLIDNIKASFGESNAPGTEKIYFTRTKFTTGSVREYGEKPIEQVFRKLGYTIISPEEYSLAQQIQFVRSCRFFASTDGSVAHLSLFCRPGTNVVIVNKSNYMNFHQVLINEYADLNVTYIEAHHSSRADEKHPWVGPFYLCVTRHLELYVGHIIIHLPYWLQFSYWVYTRNILFRFYNRVRRIILRFDGLIDG